MVYGGRPPLRLFQTSRVVTARSLWPSLAMQPEGLVVGTDGTRNASRWFKGVQLCASPSRRSGCGSATISTVPPGVDGQRTVTTTESVSAVQPCGIPGGNRT